MSDLVNKFSLRDRLRRVTIAALAATLLVMLTGARYRVREGEDYAAVAELFGIEEQLLRNANPELQVLTPGAIVTVPPSAPTPHVWSPAHPYAPPTPTVSELMQGLDAGSVVATPHPKRRGVFVMTAGRDGATPIGELRRVWPNKAWSHVVYLYPETGRGGAAGKKTKPWSKIGFTDTFAEPSTSSGCSARSLADLLSAP